MSIAFDTTQLLLTITDRKDEIADELAFDSFICGFKLALQLSEKHLKLCC